MKTCDFPVLKEYVGQDLVVTDGTTLLGADDKAGISEILAMLSHIKENPSISHPDLKIAFTPDEEVGQGADYFDVNTFGADFAYTVDGGKIGELEYENFNAAGAKIKINGRNVHPGGAKNKMINSMQIAMELNQMLPPQQRPEFTENYEGFFLLTQIEGCVEESKMQYIIRDHNRELFETKKELLKSIVTLLNQKYGENTIELELKDQYYNMREKVEPHMHIIDLAKKSMIDSGVTPLIQPIRGGTDGARLSFMGLPCPNLFTGGHNFHGIYEFIPVQSMDASVSVLIKILENSVLK
jgi:tripeptide aminopeptidase